MSDETRELVCQSIIIVNPETVRHVKMHCRCGKVFITEVPAELFEVAVALPCECGRYYRLKGNDIFTPEGRPLVPIAAVKMPTRKM